MPDRVYLLNPMGIRRRFPCERGTGEGQQDDRSEQGAIDHALTRHGRVQVGKAEKRHDPVIDYRRQNRIA